MGLGHRPRIREGSQWDPWKVLKEKMTWGCPDVNALRGFPDGSVVKNLPAHARDTVQFLEWEDPLEKEIAAHSSILAWEIPWTEVPGGLQSMGSQKSQT